MIKSYKYRLYPTKKQARSLVKQLGGHRYLYNQALQERKETFELLGESVRYPEQATGLLRTLRATNEAVAFCNYSSLQQTLRRLDKSFKSFFRRVKAGEKAGYPRFKAADRFNTIQYARHGDGCRITGARLYLQRVGNVKVKWHRPIDGTVKTFSVTHRNSRWHVSFVVECSPDPLPATNIAVGLDMGLNAFLTASDGTAVDIRQFFRRRERKLKQAQQRFARRKKGSNRRKKARRLLARMHERIANKRLDFAHKLAYTLVQKYDRIAVEKLNIKGMVRNRYLAKSISDAAWGTFFNILKAKAENAGREVVEVNPARTSQMCSACGEVVKKKLSERVHKCPNCGLILDRDHNAALNILKRARTGPSVLASSV